MCRLQEGVLPEWLKNQAKVLLVVEVSEETETVELVIRISIIKLLEELQLFQSCFLPGR